MQRGLWLEVTFIPVCSNSRPKHVKLGVEKKMGHYTINVVIGKSYTECRAGVGGGGVHKGQGSGLLFFQ